MVDKNYNIVSRPSDQQLRENTNHLTIQFEDRSFVSHLCFEDYNYLPVKDQIDHFKQGNERARRLLKNLGNK